MTVHIGRIFRHTPDFFSMTPEEKVALISLIDSCKDVIEAEFSPAGYNIGFNAGAAARLIAGGVPLF